MKYQLSQIINIQKKQNIFKIKVKHSTHCGIVANKKHLFTELVNSAS